MELDMVEARGISYAAATTTGRAAEEVNEAGGDSEYGAG
jgi:hypothetical protein